MQPPTATDPLWEKVDQIWTDYARDHDLIGKKRQAVGIDPTTGDVFLGRSAKEIITRLRTAGRARRLYFRWTDDPYYTHKGARR